MVDGGVSFGAIVFGMFDELIGGGRCFFFEKTEHIIIKVIKKSERVKRGYCLFLVGTMPTFR